MTFDSFPPASSSGVNLPPQPQTGVDVWLRRYRRYLPLPLILLCLVWLRPVMPGGNPLFDTLTDVLGVGVCLLGQWFRLWAWGSNATVGKWGVRDRGPYTLMQHPLYTGNFLIASGLVIIFNNPWAYILLLGPFAYLYHVITIMEEKRMYRRFGDEYRQYRRHDPPRFFPALSNLGAALRTSCPLDWRFAWRKEYESCCGWIAGVAALEIYEGVLLRGWEGNWPYTIRWGVIIGFMGLISLVVGLRKNAKRGTPKR